MRSHFSDNVDPYSGGLQVKIGLDIPVAGLEDLQILYSQATHRATAPAVAPLLRGNAVAGPNGTWRLTYAPTIYPVITSSSAEQTLYFTTNSFIEQMVAELPSGRTEILRFVSGSVSGNTMTRTFISRSYWRLTAYSATTTALPQHSSATEFVLTDPDGTVYDYGPGYELSVNLIGASVTYTPIYTDIKTIKRLDGATLTYSTAIVTPCQLSSLPMGPYPLMGYLSGSKKITITASSGDIVIVNTPSTWGCSSSNPTGSATVSLNGQTIATLNTAAPTVDGTIPTNVISNTANSLSSVSFPSGLNYSLRYVWDDPGATYARLVLGEIDLPTGGWVKYGYRKAAVQGVSEFTTIRQYNIGFITALDGIQYDVVSRQTSDGLVENYSYNRATGHDDAHPTANLPRYGQYDFTTITNSLGYTTVHAFYGLGSDLLPNVGLETCAGTSYCNYPMASTPHPVGWRLGLPAYTDENGARTTFSWTYQAVPIANYSFNQSDLIANRIGITDDAFYMPLLASKTQVVDGISYATNYSQFDAYGNATVTSEVGPSGTKTTSRTFATDASRNMLHKVKSETVQIMGQ